MFGSGRRRERAEEELRALARLQVRAGLRDEESQHREMTTAIAAELPDRDETALASDLLLAARADLAEELSSWPAVTDHDRLVEAFAALDALGIPVLQGVEDHWQARRLLDERPGLRGVVWFTEPDVWHAIDEGMLEINLWHGSGANAAEGDPLLLEVLSVLARHDLVGHFDEGRIEVAARWQHRLR